MSQLRDAVEKGLRTSPNSDSAVGITRMEAAMMGRLNRDQGSLFYGFRLDDRVPKDHLLSAQRHARAAEALLQRDCDKRFSLKPKHLAADTAYGTGKFLVG